MNDKFIACLPALRGIGLEVCGQLAAAGYLVILRGCDATKVDAAAAQIGDWKSEMHSLTLDTIDETFVNAAKSAVEAKYGGLDVLANNAGGNFDVSNVASTVSVDYIRATLEIKASIVGAATVPNDGPTGGFFRDGKRIPF